MASHGVPRGPAAPQKSEEARHKELDEIKQYQGLVETVNKEIAAQNYTPTLLRQTAELLSKNPEYYTIWNHRRRIYVSEFAHLSSEVQSGSLTRSDADGQVLDIIKLDLQFLFPLLLKFPKCYWIWNHRLWLLQSATELLPTAVARKLWEEDLVLAGKMLTRDARNYHGWGYRRTIISALESLALAESKNENIDSHEQEGSSSMAKSELDYTTKMIKSNLSNFSAWHNRTQLIIRFLNEQNATDEERKKMFEDELELIHSALFDPYDASLWTYHQTLLCTLDPLTSSTTMAPNISNPERLIYLNTEKEFVSEMLDEDYSSDDDEAADDIPGATKPDGDGADDCKWIYQRLIDIVLITARVRADAEGRHHDRHVGSERPSPQLTGPERRDVKRWLKKLNQLDPLRKGRWTDFEINLGLADA